MEISRGGGGGGRDDPGRMTPAQRHDENPEKHAGRSQGRNERRENFAAALPSMFSRRATMRMSRAVSSAWIRTPSSKLRLNRSRNATTMVSPGWTGPIRSRQPRAIHGAAAGHVGENQVLAYAVVGQQAQLRVQVCQWRRHVGGIGHDQHPGAGRGQGHLQSIGRRDRQTAAGAGTVEGHKRRTMGGVRDTIDTLPPA